ncbi:hypothetical protein SAMN05216410_0220 [Sanguibacter gelidistatuariae]|uniref:Lysylphosphatidylglycerol synthase TM region n=1 Tax=Sanguibacter gelidistatuariae TaxID=1814289 RepID=A0A1G6XVB2_9MICO|nr:lysylphosphatidylglycerol synthase domain-containing protein [Sanguibacter gelidistatuariae]SDD82109.1 hypothetical protein SAMN05216410_0220 [Sanguibacter gelidistatuariae]
MKRIVGALRSPVTRWVFLGVALAIAVYAVWANWADLVLAAEELSPLTIAGATVASFVYVWLTLLSWRRILTDLGSHLPLGAATSLFGVSQIGKYIPGGVWNIVAAAELGADRQIPRRRSVTAMTVAVLVSIASGAAVGCVAFALAPAEVLGVWRWALWGAPLLMVLLVPAVMNRVIAWIFRLTRREPLEHPLTARGLTASVGWAVASWLVAGLQVWLLATGLGLPMSGQTLALAVGGYALAWVVGFLVVFVPAGAGAREAVLLLVLGGSLGSGAVLMVVLASRALLTVVDLTLAGVGIALERHHKRGRVELTDRPTTLG